MSRGTLPALTALSLMAMLTSEAFEVQDIVFGHQVAAQIGEELELWCRTTGCDHPTFSWRTQMDFPLGANVTQQGNSSILTMKVGFENEHEYLCNARCGEVMKQQRVQIDIYSFPSNPVIEISHPLILGEPATITCQVPNVYPADRLQISLEKEGEVRWVTEFSQEPLIKSVETKSASVTFTPSEEDNGRKITCRAELPIDEMEFEPKEKTTTQILHVNYGPRNTRIDALPSSTVKEGDTVTMTCSAEGSPTPKVFWKKKLLGGGSQLILEGAILTIKAAQSEAMGVYECEAVNTAGKEIRTVEIVVQALSTPTPEMSTSTPELSPTTLDLSHSTPELSQSTPEMSTSTPEPSLSTLELSPSTPALTDQTEALTEVEDFNIKSTIYDIQHQVTDSKGANLEKETSLATDGRFFTTYTTSRNNTITFTVKVDDVGNSTEEDRIIIYRLEEPDFVTPVIIAVSSLATAAGPMAALLVYIFRKAKINRSYSLVNSLKPKV